MPQLNIYQHGMQVFGSVSVPPNNLYVYQCGMQVLGGIAPINITASGGIAASGTAVEIIISEKPMRVTKVDAELYSTIPHVILKPLRVTKVDGELYSTSAFISTYNQIASGGALAGGVALKSYNEIASGGVIDSGLAIENLTVNETASGGVIDSGVAIEVLTINETASGGAVGYGLAIEVLTINETTTEEEEEEEEEEVQSFCNLQCLIVENDVLIKKCASWKKIKEAWVAAVTVCNQGL